MKTKNLYICLMALFSITAFANGYNEYGGGGTGIYVGYGDYGGGGYSTNSDAANGGYNSNYQGLYGNTGAYGSNNTGSTSPNGSGPSNGGYNTPNTNPSGSPTTTTWSWTKVGSSDLNIWGYTFFSHLNVNPSYYANLSYSAAITAVYTSYYANNYTGGNTAPVFNYPPVDPCKQLADLTTRGSLANDPSSGVSRDLLTANINMLKDKLTNYYAVLTETSIEVKKNNLNFYYTNVNKPGANFSADINVGTIFIGSIHNHPTNGVALPSIIDLRLLLNTYDGVAQANRNEVFVMVVSKELNGYLAVYNLKINDIDKLRAGVEAVWNDPDLADITDEKLKDQAIKDAEALYYLKAGKDYEKTFLQKYGAFGLDLYKSSNSQMNDWGKLGLDTDLATSVLIPKKSNCN
jgi:hypothetical protein